MKSILESRKETQTVSKNKTQRRSENRLPHSGLKGSKASNLPSAESLATQGTGQQEKAEQLQFPTGVKTCGGHMLDHPNEAEMCAL